MGYKSYYQQNLHHPSGLKWVLGGTGLGKTRGIRKLIKDQEVRGDRKFIYLTNRHNLLKEMEQDLGGEIKTAYLKADPEIILDLVDKNRGNLGHIWENLSREGFWGDSLSIKRRKELNQQSKQIYHFQQLSQRKGDPTTQKVLLDQAREAAKKLYQALRKRYQALKKESPKIHESLAQSPIIHELFPFVQFSADPETPILLATIQKLMHGFFDGNDIQKLPSLKGYVIFMDEFDFLENEMLSILCQEPMLANPMDFIRAFQEGYTNWRSEPFWEQKELKHFRDRFDQILFENIESEEVKHNLRFPDIRYFRVAENFPGTENASIFHTGTASILKPFYLYPKDHFWEVNGEKTEDVLAYPWQLFRFLSRTTQRILGVFNALQGQGALRDEIIGRIWDRLNDTQPGAYRQYIRENFHFHHWKRHSTEEQAAAPELYGDSTYLSGYKLYRLLRRNDWDNGQANLSLLELATSPEAIVKKLSDQNLVFGLSATLDIPRSLRHFDLDWLKKYANVLELTPEEEQLIQSLQQQKSDIRQNTVKLQVFSDPGKNTPISFARLLDLLTANDYFRQEDRDSEDTILFRRKRVEKCLQTIEWILNSSEGDHHLVFCTSFKHISPLFDLNQWDDQPAIQHAIQDIFEVERKGPGFQVSYRNKTFNLVFLNKQKAEEIEGHMLNEGEEDPYQELFLDHKASKTIVITQYATASNGVNLKAWKWKNEEPEAIDFQGIHLLEKQEFWFGQAKAEDFSQSAERQLVWYLWKLKHKGALHWKRFKQWVDQLDANRANSYYKSLQSECYADHIRNAVALFYQALGRVDRAWIETPMTEVSFDEEILGIFQSYLEMDQERVDARETYTATFMLQLHEATREASQKAYLSGVFAQYEAVGPADDRSKTRVSYLLEQIEKLKAGELSADEAISIRKGWQALREAVLQQDFEKEISLPAWEAPLISGKDFAHTTQYPSSRFLHRGTLKLYPQKLYGEETPEWKPSRSYYPIERNEVIRRAFEQQGWPTSFPDHSKTVWTPYIEQAILMGALGEEAIRALLHHHGLLTEELPESLFEIADMKIVGKPIYIDAKYFSQGTIEKFALDPTDYGYDSAFDSEAFLAKCAEKYQILQTHHPGSHPELVVINLLGPPSGKARSYLLIEGKWEPCPDAERADLTIIYGALLQPYPQKTNRAFQAWCDTISIHSF